MEIIIGKIIDEMKKSDLLTDDEEIVRYGLEIMISKAFFAVIIAVIGLIMGCFAESIIFTISFSLLRQYGGGYHAETRKKCFYSSIITLIAALGIIILAEKVQLFTVPLLIASVISAIYILCKAPIDTFSKPLDEDEIKYYGSRARLITVILITAAVIFWCLKFNDISFTVLTGIIIEAHLMIKGQMKKDRRGANV